MTTAAAEPAAGAKAPKQAAKQPAPRPTEAGFLPRNSHDKVILWCTLIVGVLVVALASIAAAVLLILSGHPDFANGAWPIATAAVAGVVGLFAKSPASD